MKFIEILQTLNIPYMTEGNHHCRAGWIQLDCPFCGKGAGKYHMGYSIRGNFVSCWKCGGHSLVASIAEAADVPRKQAAKLLEDLVTEASNELTPDKRRGKLVLPKGLGPLLPRHVRYLRGRGFDPEQLEKLWKVQGIGLSSKLSWRVFIPIIYRGETVSWTTRAVQRDAALRYVSASEEQEAIPHKTLLYGEDYVRHACCIVEGPIDAWRIGPGCVATCGTGYSRAQVLRMSRYLVRAICFDNEPVAQQRARKLANMLSVFPGETMICTLDAKDAAEASDKEIKLLRKTVGLT